jgi:hypothetical protein
MIFFARSYDDFLYSLDGALENCQLSFQVVISNLLLEAKTRPTPEVVPLSSRLFVFWLGLFLLLVSFVSRLDIKSPSPYWASPVLPFPNHCLSMGFSVVE